MIDIDSFSDIRIIHYLYNFLSTLHHNNHIKRE